MMVWKGVIKVETAVCRVEEEGIPLIGANSLCVWMTIWF